MKFQRIDRKEISFKKEEKNGPTESLTSKEAHVNERILKVRTPLQLNEDDDGKFCSFLVLEIAAVPPATPPIITRISPIISDLWPDMGNGTGPLECIWIQDLVSQSNDQRSL